MLFPMCDVIWVQPQEDCSKTKCCNELGTTFQTEQCRERQFLLMQEHKQKRLMF